METKPAIYTTEFWAVMLVNLANLIAACADVLPARYAAIGSVIVTGLYAVGRGLAKMNATPDPSVPGNAKLVPKRKDMHARH